MHIRSLQWLLVAILLSIRAVSGALPQVVPDAPASSPHATLDPSLSTAKGSVDIVVRLSDPPLAALTPANAKRTGAWLTRAQQQAVLVNLKTKQDATVAAARSLGGYELARVSRALNAVILRIDASKLAALTTTTNIISIRPVQDYQKDLSETVPYIGASAVQALGFDGRGVKVAVLDSGVDYTHKNLGGPGTPEAYVAAYGSDPTNSQNKTLDGLFPTDKVIGGYDFVGEDWPNTDLAPDPDPIDFEGHGTHVADIIAGRSLDGTHRGVAPGAKLFAIKVCSSVASACSGVALLQGMDFALDPNGDGDMSDAVDVINMSLGSSYGQREDDLSAASAMAVRLGVVVVAASGNDGDKPYVTSSPASTPEVISVAQTQVPSARKYPLVINSPASIAGQYPNTETVGWAPVGAGFSGNVAYVGRGCPGDTYLADPAGKVALIVRGSCAVSLKIDRAAKAGAIGVLLAMTDGSDPISFSFGGGDTFVPTLIITKAVSDKIRANLSAPVNVTVSPANSIALVGGVVGSSSRGPSYSYSAIKPDIGAPGASVSAEVGTGTGETAFGGTSGATPMISGSAALLLQAHPDRTPAEIKSLLMNSAETSIQTDRALLPGVLAPISRIGGGEVRVDRALASSTAAWDKDALTGSLSFGYQAFSESGTITRAVLVRNYSNKSRTYTISSGFRYANDSASGAVAIQTPATVKVSANGVQEFPVTLKVNAARLPDWGLNGGALGGAGPLLQNVEFDGYIHVADTKDDVHLAWQILPHKAAAVSASLNADKPVVTLDNRQGATAGGVEVFSLTGQSPAIKKKFLPSAGDNFAVIDLQSVGVRMVDLGGEPGIQFAIHTRGARSHPNYPALFDVALDLNGDGVPDFEIFNSELGAFASSGQNAVFVFDDVTGVATPVFYTDADLDSANVILTAPLSAIGLDPGSQFVFSVYAIDNYFTGAVTDQIETMAYTLGSPAFSVAGGGSYVLAAGSRGSLPVSIVPANKAASPSQTGLLLLYRDARQQKESDLIKLAP
jgi:subtilisin family serine protease